MPSCNVNADGLYQYGVRFGAPTGAWSSFTVTGCTVFPPNGTGGQCAVVDAQGNRDGFPPFPSNWWPGGWNPNGQYFGLCVVTHALCNAGTFAEPVNTLTGNYSTSVTDASYPGIGIPFDFKRSYNSLDTTSSILGPGWTDSYNARLAIDGTYGDVTLFAEDGRQIRFFLQGNGSFTSLPGVTDTLSPGTGGSYVLLTKAQVTYTFSSSGQLLSEVNPNGEGLSFSYTSGNLTGIIDSVGRAITLSYTSGNLTGLSLPDGRSVSYGYTAGQLTSAVDMRGNTTQYHYDTGGRLDQITDQNGNILVKNQYGSDGRVTDQWSGPGLAHHGTFAWDPSTGTATYTDPRGKAWKDAYDSGNLIQRTDPLGDATKYGYDSIGNMISATDAGNNTTGPNTTIFRYDASSNLIEQDDPSPLSYIKTWGYNSLNEVTSHTDGRTNITRYEYDSRGNLTCILNASAPAGTTHCSDSGASGYKTTFGVDPTTGQTTSMTDPNGNASTYGYNALGELTSITGPPDPFGSGGSTISPQTTFTYWPSGMLKTRVDPRGNVSGGNPSLYTWNYGYNNANQITSVADPLADQTSYAYDKVGNLITLTDPPSQGAPTGAVTRYEYDASNNLSCVLYPTVPSGTTTCAAAAQQYKANYGYDANNNLNLRTDANGDAWSFGYDDANRLNSKTSPKAKVWAYGWWPDGLLKQLTLPSGNVQYSYDQLDRLTGLTYSNTSTPNVTYGYDGNNNRTQMTDGVTGTASYTYDNLNQLKTLTRGSDVFHYNYTPGGQLQQVEYPDSQWASYGYYADNSPCWALAGNSMNTCSSVPVGAVRFSNDAASEPITKTVSNTDVATMGYDTAGRLTSVTNKQGSTTLSSYTLTLDGVGNPTKDVTNAGTINYTYDALNRVLTGCYSSCTGTGRDGYTYTYDYAGNITKNVRDLSAGNTTTTYSYNNDDQLCWSLAGTSSNGCNAPPTGSTSYTFGANGNESAAGSTTYSWDLENRLISTTTGSNTYAYGYDGDGNRQSKSKNATPTNTYVWDPNGSLPRLVMERNGSGSELRRYVYGGGGLLQMNDGTTDHSYMTDPLGSVANLTSTSGASEIAYSYDPFGNSRGTIPSSPTNFMRFDSQFLDTNIGLYDLRARQYDPSLGRFLEVDSLVSPIVLATTAPYVYVLDRPTVASDPSGLWCLIHNSSGGCLGSAALDATAAFAQRHIWQVVEGAGVGLCIVAATLACLLGGVAIWAGQTTVLAETGGATLGNVACSFFKSFAVAVPGLATTGLGTELAAWMVYATRAGTSAPQIGGLFSTSWTDPGCIGGNGK